MFCLTPVQKKNTAHDWGTCQFKNTIFDNEKLKLKLPLTLHMKHIVFHTTKSWVYYIEYLNMYQEPLHMYSFSAIGREGDDWRVNYGKNTTDFKG